MLALISCISKFVIRKLPWSHQGDQSRRDDARRDLTTATATTPNASCSLTLLVHSHMPLFLQVPPIPRSSAASDESALSGVCGGGGGTEGGGGGRGGMHRQDRVRPRHVRPKLSLPAGDASAEEEERLACLYSALCGMSSEQLRNEGRVTGPATVTLDSGFSTG